MTIWQRIWRELMWGTTPGLVILAAIVGLIVWQAVKVQVQP